MARIALNCSCGWNFFIPGSTAGHEVTCPSCGQTVRIPGRKPGQPVPTSAGAIAAEKQRQQRMIKMMVGAGIAVVVAAGIIIAFTAGGKPAEEVASPTRKDDNPFGPERGTGRNRSPQPKEKDFELPPPPPPPPPLYSTSQIQELRRDVYASVWMTNMTGLLAECMRYRNLTSEWGLFQADMARYDQKIKNNLTELAKVGEKLALEPYLLAGDQIVGFIDMDFTKAKAGDAAQYIHTWINNWRAGPGLAQTNILRADKNITLYLEFPEETRELLSLVRHPSLGQLGTPTDGALQPVVAVPADVMNDVTKGFEGLPKGYRGMLGADQKKLETLLLTKKGPSDDVEWLKTKVIAEMIPSFQREAATIRSKILELDAEMKKNIASDVIYRKNGAKPLEGQIIQETETFVKVKSRFGSVQIQREDIERIEKGKGTAVEFPLKFDQAKGNLEKLVPLLDWCTEKGLKLEKDYVAYTILTLDASHDKARKTLALPRPTGGSLNAPPKDPEMNSTAKLERTIELIATDVTNRNKIFSDVILEMRRRTETLTTQTPPLAPGPSIKGASVIRDPLTFKPSELTGKQALEIGGWWGGLSPEDRREFAKYFGLWCAYVRGMKK